MIRSMTAFARREMTAPWGSARWELRSVNNRFLDIAPRLPEELRLIESALRERVGRRVRRGKVDCVLRVSQEGGPESRPFTLDLDLAQRLADASREVDHLIQNPARINSMDLLRWPGVVRADTLDLDTVAGETLELLDAALDDLVATRAREGERIRTLLLERCASIEALVAVVRERVPELLEQARERLATRLAELRAQLDAERIEQEMALLATKSDVAEELDRLESHLVEVRRALDQDEPVGRRLDFLMQELQREANTLGSKALDARTSRASVDLKVLIEQMREQIQNLE
jgi:uncharacterized protein (TIGR00255 family)